MRRFLCSAISLDRIAAFGKTRRGFRVYSIKIYICAAMIIIARIILWGVCLKPLHTFTWSILIFLCTFLQYYFYSTLEKFLCFCFRYVWLGYTARISANMYIAQCVCVSILTSLSLAPSLSSLSFWWPEKVHLKKAGDMYTSRLNVLLIQSLKF